MEVCYRALLFMPVVVVVISQHLLNVVVQLANKRGFKKNLYRYRNIHYRMKLKPAP
jgi:E3 ubiquitin-protein ligase DOA10